MLINELAGWPTLYALFECGCPTLRAFRRVGAHVQSSPKASSSSSNLVLVTRRLHRYYGAGYLHFITSSCYRRQALLGSAHRRKLFLEILEQVRRRYRFVVVGYVIMPEHFHLLIREPERGNPSIVMQVLKQRFARHLLTQWRKRNPPHQPCLWKEALDVGHVWQRRFYDFVVWSKHKQEEKLNYMHRNPVKRGLVLQPEQWPCSSFRHYAYNERGPVLVNERQRAVMTVRAGSAA